MPNLDFRGTPMGIDIRKVIETSITPVINTAIVSSKAVGMMVLGSPGRPFPCLNKLYWPLWKN